ncbi:MAG TPA: hypothetical protein VID70_11270 [Solirubrobacteraceae bacterium]|jgi:hypothetical protein
MPRFCRHGRFIERCPICRDTVPELARPKGSAVGAGRSRGSSGATARRAPRSGARNLRVYRDGVPRGEDDGYRSALLPTLHNSADAQRLAREVAFSHGRLLALENAPPDLYAEIRQQDSWERATWMCFLAAYLSPLQGEAPFIGIRQALHACGGGRGEVPDWRAADELGDLADVALGPRTSHDPARGADTLRGYLQWAERAGSQVRAFSGDPTWSEQRRFERVFERLQLPGLGRMGRYELLVTVGRLGLYELHADSLHFAGAATHATDDLATLTAKRLFGIGDPFILERRAGELAEAIAVPIEALDLAFANWGAGERANLGVPDECSDAEALARAHGALEL